MCVWAAHLYKNTNSAFPSQLLEQKASQFIVSLLLIPVAATTFSATATATSAIVLGYDGSANALYLLVLLLHFLSISLGVGVHPRLAIFQCIHDLLLLLEVKLFTEAFVLSRPLHS